jgi:hypothetical protein
MRVFGVWSTEKPRMCWWPSRAAALPQNCGCALGGGGSGVVATFKHDRAVAVVLNTGVTQERRRRHFRSPEQLQAAAAAGDEGISPAIAIEHFFLKSISHQGRSGFFSMVLRQTCQLVCSILLIARNHQASNFSRNRNHFFNQFNQTTRTTHDADGS